MPVIWNSAREIRLCSTIQLFTQSAILFTSLWTHAFLFYTLDYKPVQFYFIAQVVLDLAIGSSFSWLLCLFDKVPSALKKKKIFPYLTLGEDNNICFHEGGFLNLWGTSGNPQHCKLCGHFLREAHSFHHILSGTCSAKKEVKNHCPRVKRRNNTTYTFHTPCSFLPPRCLLQFTASRQLPP